MRQAARQKMELYELSPSDDGYPIPSDLYSIGAACDRWFRRREARDGSRRFVFGRMGSDLAPKPVPEPVRVAATPKPRKRGPKPKIRYVEMTEAQKQARRAQKARWRARNVDKAREQAREYQAKLRATLTPEQLREKYDRQAECRRKRKEIANGVDSRSS
jgi:hypothetical protein